MRQLGRPTGHPFLDAVCDRPGSVLAFAHRGGAFHPELEGLENTRAAFTHAVALGYWYLETDVHATRDDVLLAFHDPVLDRVTDRAGAIAQHDHAVIAQALVGDREHVPTLASLLEEFPQARFNIDLKSDAAVQPLVALLESMRAHDRVCVGSFDSPRIRRFRRSAGPRVATAAAPAEVAVRRFAPAPQWAIRLLPGPRGDVLQVPHRLRGITVVTGRLVERAHAAGLPVHVWTVDDPQEIDELLDMGVDGIMTDRTDVLRDVLIRRGQWLEAPR
ncbi:MAG TPA: glycerophosphodiester phosphodiesterase family protein [Nocardioidaceae bacterium]|nr:glycerophosphodiester phosphodiesterase family protein [Nocardioidaceae bacterium]